MNLGWTRSYKSRYNTLIIIVVVYPDNVINLLYKQIFDVSYCVYNKITSTFSPSQSSQLRFRH